MSVYHDIATKLRLTETALGCTSRKDLCLRFLAINPSTYCDLDRLQKWFQGRALPRVPQFYDDWTKLLGLSRPGVWLATCEVEALRAELAGVGRAMPEASASEPTARSRRVGNATGIMGGPRVLCGQFACYSQAWAPRHRGALIRGSLAIRSGKGAKLIATYSETLVGGSLRINGDVVFSGRTLHLPLWEPEGNLPIFFSVIMSGPPVSVLCGVMSGAAFVAHAPLPSASRVLMVRVPEAAALDASNRYLPRSRDFLSRDLAALGVRPGRSVELDGLATAFFAAGAEQVGPVDHDAFAELLDRVEFVEPLTSVDARRPSARLRVASER